MDDLGRLRRVSLFADLTDEDMEMLAEQCHPGRLEDGDLLFGEGDWGDAAYLIESGDVDILKDAGGREVLLATRGPGEVIGEMALLRGEPRMASARARTGVDLLVIPQQALNHLLECSPTAARGLFQTILDRFVETEALLKQRERMAQLGTLTAGVAHELNNPAAAVSRAAGQLADAVHSYARTVAEAAATLDDEGREAVTAPRTDGPHDVEALGPLERADRENEIEEALEAAGVEEPWTLSADLVEAGVGPDDLAGLRRTIGDGDLAAALRTLGAGRTVDALLRTIVQGSERVSVIVKALRSYSFLDQAPLQDVDVTVGIEDTLLILGTRLRGIRVERDFDPELRTVEAHGSELNQVWTNLLANAADAIEERREAEGEGSAGRITITARNSQDGIVVEVTDDGAGIPPEVADRIFDSFFTTKAPGKGTGLGLDLSHRIVVTGHGGDLSVDSEPGRTTFRTELPAHQPDSTHDGRTAGGPEGPTTDRSASEGPGAVSSVPCEHLEGVTFEDVRATECPDCVASGDTWVHLRQCVRCGAVGCCNSSTNRHASRHAAETGHPTARSAEPGELWVWCYVHEVAASP